MISLRTKIEKAEKLINVSKTEHIKLLDNHSFLVNDSKCQPYIPSKTGLKFHTCDDLYRLILGPYGSGKSTICAAEIVLRAITINPCSDGIRRSRWAIVRNTYGEIETTTLKTWNEWFGELGTIHKKMSPRISYFHEFYDEKGKIELELMFLALDRPDDIGKIRSLEVTGIYINEISQVPQAAFVHLKSRIPRFPAQRAGAGEYWHGIICDTNPPDTDHWLYNLFEVQQPPQHVIFHQPPAILKTENGYEVNSEADNLDHLNNGNGARYYEEMILGQTEEFIKVYAMGFYGTVVEGKRVYTNYNDDLHSIESVDLYEDEPILLAWDFGIVCPACLLCQYIDGRLHIVKEFIGEYITVTELYNRSVLPFLSEYCDGFTIEAVGDPANTYNGIEQLEEAGLPIEKAKSNNIEPRVSSVRGFLNCLVDGQPGFVLSRLGCPKLRQGFNGKYSYRRLKVVGEERYQDVPDKSHPHSDIHDCLQYAAMHYKMYYNSIEGSDELIFEDNRGKSKVGGY